MPHVSLALLWMSELFDNVKAISVFAGGVSGQIKELRGRGFCCYLFLSVTLQPSGFLLILPLSPPAWRRDAELNPN